MKRIGAGFGATIAAGLGTVGGFFSHGIFRQNNFIDQPSEQAIVQEIEMPNTEDIEHFGDRFTSTPDESEETTSDRSQDARDLGRTIGDVEGEVNEILKAKQKAKEAKEAEEAKEDEDGEETEEEQEAEAEEGAEEEAEEGEQAEEPEEAKEAEQAEGLPPEQEPSPEADNDYDYDYGIGM
jgi:hypothetical protein